jgi:hypothetical protein
MRFTFYTDKTVAQCVQALQERLQSGSKLQGRVDRGSPHFSLTSTTKVFRNFARSTRLQGTLTREEGVTVIKCYVSQGVERGRWLLLLLGALILAVIFYAAGNAILTIMTVLIGLWSYIPLTGDAENSDFLLRELKRVLQAKDTKPKAEKADTSSAPSGASARPSANPSPFGSSRTAAPPPSSASRSSPKSSSKK